MSLTPLDVENTRFRGALGGYNRFEVEQFQQRVSQALEGQLAEIRQLQQRIKNMEDEVSRYRESEELLRNSVMLAQKTCDELIAVARRKAELIQDEALAEGDVLKHQFAELRSQREQFEYAFHGLLTGFINRLEQGNPQLSGDLRHAALQSGSVVRRSAEMQQSAVAMHAATAESADHNRITDYTPGPEHDSRAGPGERPAAQASGASLQAASAVDRDNDLDDFSAVIAGAQAAEVVWPGEHQDAGEPAGPIPGTDIITALINRESRQQHAAMPETTAEPAAGNSEPAWTDPDEADADSGAAPDETDATAEQAGGH